MLHAAVAGDELRDVCLKESELLEVSGAEAGEEQSSCSVLSRKEMTCV